ncbi:hypothetical protein AGMMS50229_17780 [Campylobacterota bacterium]|nr:hypothetical protein AGMMS50229_17780 [Campylobacterota bacterium]
MRVFLVLLTIVVCVWAGVYDDLVAEKQVELQETVRQLTQVIELYPTQVWAYKGRGSAYVILGDLEKATEDAHMACSLGDCALLIELKKDGKARE